MTEIVPKPPKTPSSDPPHGLVAGFAIATLVLFVVVVVVGEPTKLVIGGFVFVLALTLCLGNVQAVSDLFRGK